MAGKTRLGLYGGPRPAYDNTIVVAPPLSIATGGTIVGAEEADIVAGGKTILLTVSEGTWVSFFAFDLIRPALLAGLTSAQSEEFGWNNEVRDKFAVTAAVRTSDTVVTITLPISEFYSISVSEYITATVPAVALNPIPAAEVIAAPVLEILTTGSLRWPEDIELGVGAWVEDSGLSPGTWVEDAELGVD